MNYNLDPRNYAAFVNTTGVSNLMPKAKSFVKPSISQSPILNPPAAIVEGTVPQEYLGEAQRLYDDAWASFKAA